MDCKQGMEVWKLGKAGNCELGKLGWPERGGWWCGAGLRVNRDGNSCGVSETFKILIKPTFSVFALIESTLMLNFFDLYTFAHIILSVCHLMYGMVCILYFILPFTYPCMPW